MSEPKHTPGPWEWYNDSFDYGCPSDLIRVADNGGLNIIISVDRDGRIKVEEADARLIASAPDLLAACEAALEEIEAFFFGALRPGCEAETEFDDMWNRYKSRSATYRKLQSAIAKAKGAGNEDCFLL